MQSHIQGKRCGSGVGVRLLFNLALFFRHLDTRHVDEIELSGPDDEVCASLDRLGKVLPGKSFPRVERHVASSFVVEETETTTLAWLTFLGFGVLPYVCSHRQRDSLR